jgi:hypothetical protein
MEALRKVVEIRDALQSKAKVKGSRQRDSGCASGWAATVEWSGGVKKRKLLLWRRQHQEKNSWRVGVGVDVVE